MFEPIVVRTRGYEARTDGAALEIRSRNGVVIGEGRIGFSGGAFHVGEYQGALHEGVYGAVRKLLAVHGPDIAARWMAAGSRRGAEPS